MDKNLQFAKPRSPDHESGAAARPEWTQDTEAKLLQFADQFNKNWHLVSKSLGIFCEKECQKKHAEISQQETPLKWTPREDAGLLVLRPLFNHINWFECATFFPGRSPVKCQRRLAWLLKDDVLVGGWSYREQIAIFRYTRACKFSWKEIIQLIPCRSQNAVKSYFHSTIRRLKKSHLKDFLKNMVAWPTYTNKSKFDSIRGLTPFF